MCDSGQPAQVGQRDAEHLFVLQLRSERPGHEARRSSDIWETALPGISNRRKINTRGRNILCVTRGHFSAFFGWSVLFLQTTTTQTTTSTVTSSPPATTTTSTATATLLVPTATSYAACAPNNQAGTVNGEGISIFGDSSSGNADAILTTGDADAYNCCVSCITNPFCQAYGFLGLAPSGQQCYIFSNAACSAEGQYQFQDYPDGPYPDSGYVIGNGNCGFFTSTVS